MPLVWIPTEARDEFIRMRAEADYKAGHYPLGDYRESRAFARGVEAVSRHDLCGHFIMAYDMAVMNSAEIVKPWAWIIYPGDLITWDSDEPVPAAEAV